MVSWDFIQSGKLPHCFQNKAQIALFFSALPGFIEPFFLDYRRLPLPLHPEKTPPFL